MTDDLPSNVEEYRGGWGFGYVRRTDGSSVDAELELPVAGITDPVAFDLTFELACALQADHTVVCWDGSEQLAVAAPLIDAASGSPLAGVQEIAVARNTGCARLAGSVACWGEGFFGALGDGETQSHESPTAQRVRGSDGVGLLDDVIAIDGNYHGFCVVRSGGSVWCWGSATEDPGGDGLPVAVDVQNAVSVSVGTHHACALLNDGSVVCWGANFDGQLGSGTIGEASTVPVKVLGL